MNDLEQLKPQQLLYWRVEHTAADLEDLEQLSEQQAGHLIVNVQALTSDVANAKK